MPCPVVAADKLPQFATALYKKVGRHLYTDQCLEVWVGVVVEAIAKKTLYAACAVLLRWQADAVQHNHVDLCIERSFAEIG